MSSNPARVTIKIPLAREATGNHLIQFTSLKNTQSPVSGLCYARNRVCDAVYVDEKGEMCRFLNTIIPQNASIDPLRTEIMHLFLPQLIDRSFHSRTRFDLTRNELNQWPEGAKFPHRTDNMSTFV